MPALNNSYYSIFKNLLFFFDKEFSKLNMKLFLNKYYNNSFNNNSIDSSLINNITDDVDSIFFFKKTKFFKYPSSFNLINESIDFRYELFKHFSNLKFDINNNFTNSEIVCLFKFLRVKPFKVIDTDKNVGLVIISNELHDSLILSNLNNLN